MRMFMYLGSILLLSILSISTLNATDITLDASNSTQAVAVNSLSWLHKTSGADAVLAVSLVVGSSQSIVSVTYNGVNLTEAGNVFVNSMTTSLWYLSNPDLGVHTVEVQISGSADILGGSHSYNGVNQLTPFRNVSALIGNSVNASTNINSNPDDLVIDVAGFINEEPSAGPGQKEIFLRQGSLNMGSSFQDGAALVEMSWQNSTDQWGLVAGSLQPVAPLPVELVEFSAHVNQYQVVLNWITAAELNNDYFAIEKSRDGVDWQLVKEIAGAGNSDAFRHYTVTDGNPFSGTSYYRLRQVDFDGSFEISDQLSVEVKTPISKLHLFPNPVYGEDEINMVFNNSQSNSQITLQLTDLMGRLLFAQEFSNLAEGSNTLRIPLSQLSNVGMYLLQIIDSQQRRQLAQEKFFFSGNN